MRLIRVMCSGRVDLAHILRAFQKGMDGVFIGACHLNECNYITHGNYHAQNTVYLGKRILEHVGLNPERLRIQFMSGAEANIFVESVNDCIRKIKEIGPLGKGKGETADGYELKSRLADVARLVPYIKVVNQDKLTSRIQDPDECEKLFTKEEIDTLFRDVVSYYIDPERCQACMTCARRCPVEAIISAKNQVHIIDQEKCIKCGTCFEVCPPRFGAVTKIVGAPVPPPLPDDKRAIVRKAKEKEVA